jgi:glycerol-3-phosphate cytidylyltransferase
MRTGITFSTFDLLHAGHVLMLQEARQHCDYLIACLQTDPTIDRPDTKNAPVQSVVERQIQLQAVSHVDQVIIYQTEQDLLDLLTILQPNVRFLGEEYRDKEFTGRQWCMDNGVELYFNSRKHRFSTTDLRKRTVAAEVK